MFTRLAVATTTVLLALLCSGLTSSLRDPVLALATRGLGERSYAVRLKDLPVGQLQQLTSKTYNGNLSYKSVLGFQLAQGQPVRVTEEKLFSGRPPYNLLRAHQRDVTAATTSLIELRRSKRGNYEANIRRGANTQQQHLDWQHTLKDYLAVEQWLPQATPGIATTFYSLDFGQLGLRRDVWTLNKPTAEGWEVTKSSPVEATKLLLDRNFKPLRFSMAGTFEIEAIDPALLPIAPEPVFHSSTYQVAVNKSIANHESLASLTLRVEGNTSLVAEWDTVSERDSATLIRSTANQQRPAQSEDKQQYLREELSYPVNMESVRSLARSAVNPLASAREQANQLVGFVHNYISYDHHSTMQNVLDVIHNRRGDCNEYAELLTTLGRALGIPTRTIIGLAYTEERAPAFALHAWNEVLLDGAWHALDPTWNQSTVDATHLRMPDTSGGLLQGITSLNELTFEVVSASYFEPAARSR